MPPDGIGVTDAAAGFDDLAIGWLRAKPGAKWHQHPGRLNAWVADMDFPPPPVVVAALHRRLDQGDLGYPDWGYPRPVSPVPQVFVERMASRHGWEVPVGEVRELCDVTQGVQVALHLATSPGDGVVLHTPSYPPLWRTLRHMGLRQIDVPARRATAAGDDEPSVVFDHDALAAQLERTPARVLLLCSPHNPTGHRFRRHELEQLLELAVRHELLVISDEIHADLTHGPERHVPFASLGPEAATRTVTITSASKAFNLAGMRHALAHVGPADLRERMDALPDHLLGEVGLLAATATEAAWRHGDEWLAAALAHLDRNRRLLAELLARHLPQVRYRPPEATYLAWLDCRGLHLGDDPAVVFRERGVELSPGLDFGPAGAGHVRLNMATSGAVLTEVVERMASS